MVIQDGDYLTAGIWVTIVLLIALAIIIVVNLISGREMERYCTPILRKSGLDFCFLSW